MILSTDGGTDEIATSRRTALVRAVERVQPAVVSIYATYREKVWYPYRDPFWHFFAPRFYVPGERERTFGGSGLIVSSEGYILTNDHVLGPHKKPRRIVVTLTGAQTYEAEYIGSDLAFDLAILKIKADDLPVARLGNSDDILVGEWAIAIGNPFDVGVSVSAGIISGINRDFPQAHGDYFYWDMFQTDSMSIQ